MKKYILISFIGILTQFACKKPEGKITGVLTYSYKFSIEKPDVGANIYVVNANDLDSEKVKALYIYVHVKGSIELIENMEEVIKFNSEIQVSRDPNAPDNSALSMDAVESNWRILKSYNINSKEDFLLLEDQFDDQVDYFIRQIKTKLYKADGIGRYSIALPAGIYYVLIQSRNKKGGNTIAEMIGKIDFKKVVVVPGKESNYDYSF